MKPQQALSNIEDYLSGFPADVIGDNQEEFETLHAVVEALPVLIKHLEKANYNWREYDYESEELEESIEFLKQLKRELSLD